MKTYLVTFLRWLLAKLGAFPSGSAPVLTRLKDLAVEAHGLTVSGERKRSYVINRVKAEFPDIRTRDLAFLLEQIVRELD